MRNLKTSKAHRILIISALVLLALVLLGAMARRWLESPGGQELLQRELSRSLGMVAEIDEGYELGFFPRLSIEGGGLIIAGPGGEGRFIASNRFEAIIELMPLLRQQVRITSIELSDGSVDFSHAPKESSAESEGAGGKATLPQVGSLLVQNFLIHAGEGDFGINLERLYLTDFRTGAAVPLELETAIIDDAGTKARFELRGNFTFEEIRRSVQLEVDELQIESGGFSLTGISGSWHWLPEPSTLEGRLSWLANQHGASIELGLKLGETLTGAIRGEYHGGQIHGRIETDFRLSEKDDRLEMGATRIEVAGQVVTGKGCMVWTDVPVVKLILNSDELDLDTLRPLIPESESEGVSLPVDLEISLSIAKTRLEGAEAVDTKVIIGREPTCP